MVEEYSNIADEVVVIISDPKKDSSLRKTPSGRIITPEMSKQIWEIYTKPLKNVKVIISNKPSPVVAAYDYIETLKPIYLEALPLTLEEIFISETEVVGYDMQSIIL